MYIKQGCLNHTAVADPLNQAVHSQPLENTPQFILVLNNLQHQVIGDIVSLPEIIPHESEYNASDDIESSKELENADASMVLSSFIFQPNSASPLPVQNADKPLCSTQSIKQDAFLANVTLQPHGLLSNQIELDEGLNLDEPISKSADKSNQFEEGVSQSERLLHNQKPSAYYLQQSGNLDTITSLKTPAKSTNFADEGEAIVTLPPDLDVRQKQVNKMTQQIERTNGLPRDKKESDAPDMVGSLMVNKGVEREVDDNEKAYQLTELATTHHEFTPKASYQDIASRGAVPMFVSEKSIQKDAPILPDNAFTASWDAEVMPSGLTDENLKKLTLHFNQGSLGEITAKIEVDDKQSSIRFLTETHETRQLIQHHVPELKETFNEANLQLVQTTIEHQFNKNKHQKDESNPFLFEHEEEATKQAVKGRLNQEKSVLINSVVDTYA